MMMIIIIDSNNEWQLSNTVDVFSLYSCCVVVLCRLTSVVLHFIYTCVVCDQLNIYVNNSSYSIQYHEDTKSNHAIAYASRKLLERERRYPIIEWL